jgi:hypothetical protein
MLDAELANHFNRIRVEVRFWIRVSYRRVGRASNCPQILRVAKLGVYTPTYRMAEWPQVRVGRSAR